MTGFDPDRATRQLFVDGILGAMGQRGGDSTAYGFGWHFVELVQDAREAIITFETPRALVGWDAEGKGQLEGPHRVMVTVTNAPPRGY